MRMMTIIISVLAFPGLVLAIYAGVLFGIRANTEMVYKQELLVIGYLIVLAICSK